MKILITILFLIITTQVPQIDIINSTWKYRITSKCINTLKFKPKGILLRYDCELDYTMQGTYTYSKDTLIVIEKDDSHPEDGSKPSFYKTKFFVRNDLLCPISNAKLVHGKWVEMKVKYNKADKHSYFKRAK